LLATAPSPTPGRPSVATESEATGSEVTDSEATDLPRDASQAPRSAEATARRLGLMAVLGAVTCFAISYSVIKWPGTSGAVIAWWRLVVSTVIWWALLWCRRRWRGSPLPDRRTWALVTPAALSFGINISVLFTAVTRTSVAHSEFIMALSPVLLAPLGVVLFGERPNWRSLRWAALSFIGLVIVLAAGPSNGDASLSGDLLVVVALVVFLGYLVGTKRARSAGVGVADFMSILMPVAVITATPVALITARGDIWPDTGTTWASIGILAVLTGMAAHGLLVFAQRSVPIATIGLVQTSQPAFSTFWAWLLIDEAVAIGQIPGMALVIGGLGLVLWTSRTR